MNAEVRDVLSHPLVLYAAWHRVRIWYRCGEWAPEPEYSRWDLDPDEAIARLGERIRNGYRLEGPWPLLPYPKKGRQIRHYCQPTVADQVVFTAFGILLAPSLEAGMPNFSFGNRWYHGVHWRHHKEEWGQRPFALRDRHIYQPYRRSYGLFRRVAHWSADALLGDSTLGAEAPSPRVRREDYAKDRIPPFCWKGWWEAAVTDMGYWSRLDLQLAYPSVSIERLGTILTSRLDDFDLSGAPLRERMTKVVRELISPPPKFGYRSLTRHFVRESLSAYPGEVRQALAQPAIRRGLADELIRLLREVRYDASNYDGIADPWLPPHTTQKLPLGNGEGHPGIPTGLTISGLLFNVYLAPFDEHMVQWLKEEQKAHRPAAFLRFADDMILLAPTQEQILAGIDQVWQGLEGDPDARPARLPNEGQGSNLRLNLSKLTPEPVANIASRYLCEQGWQRCDACKTPSPPEEGRLECPSLSQWWSELAENDSDKNRTVDGTNRHAEDDWDKGRILDEWKKEAVTPERPGQFVTHLVERMSELANETLLDRFGDAALDRLDRLHDLARFQLDDGEVRTDSRLSFVANHLAKARLPEEDATKDREQIKAMRDSAALALWEAPWRFTLWRSLFRLAARRPVTAGDAPEERVKDHDKADNWLSDLLALVACNGRWSKDWPESAPSSECWPETTQATPGDQMRTLILGYHRTAFWRALADIIKDLRRTSNALEDLTGPVWSADQWSFRALNEPQIAPVAERLGDMNRWSQILYGSGEGVNCNRVEAEAVMHAVLAIHTRAEIADALVRCSAKHADAPLALPSPDPSLRMPPVIATLLSQAGCLTNDPQRLPSLACLRLAGPDREEQRRGLRNLLPKLTGRDEDERRQLLVLTSRLGLARWMDLRSLRYWGKRLDELIGQALGSGDIAVRYRALRLYAMARRVVLSRWGGALGSSAEATTLHGLVWGTAWDDPALTEWRCQPAAVPALGLPIRIALRLFRDALEALDGTRPGDWPTTWCLTKDTLELLAWGRRMQLEIDTLVAPASVRPNEEGRSTDNDRWVRLVADSDTWEVPPHPVFFLNRVLNGESEEPSELAFHQVLHFLTAATGSERYADSLFDSGPSAVPFEERLDLRNRIPLPVEIWREIDKLQNAWHAERTTDPKGPVGSLRRRLDELLQGQDPEEDFRAQRIDIRVSLEPSLDLPIQLEPPTDLIPIEEVEGTLVGNLTVRIAQVQAAPCRAELRERFDRLKRSTRQVIMRQVWSLLLAVDHRSNDEDSFRHPELAVLPELAIPAEESRALTRLSERTGTALLAGLTWQEVKPAYGAHSAMTCRRRFLANEALLTIPVSDPAKRGPTTTRQFRIRKPIPAHIEYGFAEALSRNGEQWGLIPGRLWYRFLHPRWGDFTIAICADLIDPLPWNALRGRLLHLFQCAYNQDVDLFEALTWVRAYENYVNVVSVNHGCFGGSFIWTPKKRFQRELARLRGNNLMLSADADLPISDMLEAQKNGVQNAVDKAHDEWKEEDNVKKDTFKAPPPGFRRN